MYHFARDQQCWIKVYVHALPSCVLFIAPPMQNVSCIYLLYTSYNNFFCTSFFKTQGVIIQGRRSQFNKIQAPKIRNFLKSCPFSMKLKYCVRLSKVSDCLQTREMALSHILEFKIHQKVNWKLVSLINFLNAVSIQMLYEK